MCLQPNKIVLEIKTGYMRILFKVPGVGDGQGGLACCDSWGCKESDMTELN